MEKKNSISFVNVKFTTKCESAINCTLYLLTYLLLYIQAEIHHSHLGVLSPIGLILYKNILHIKCVSLC